MRHLRNQHGFIKPLLWIIIIIVIVYVGIQFGTPHYKYQMLVSDAKDFARSELGNVEKIKAKLYESAERRKIPLREGAISVTLGKEVVIIKASWSETVDLLGFYQKTLKFNLNVEE